MGFTLSDNSRLFKNYVEKVNAISQNGGIGEIDGVVFDLSYEGRLDTHRWSIFPFLDSVLFHPGEKQSAKLRNSHSIWYPWFGEYDASVLKRKLLQPHRLTPYESSGDGERGRKLRVLSETEVEAIIDASKPLYNVERGDKIIVLNVRDHKLSGEIERYGGMAKDIDVAVIRNNGTFSVKIDKLFTIYDQLYVSSSEIRDFEDPFQIII